MRWAVASPCLPSLQFEGMSRSYVGGKPRTYAREKLGMLQRRKAGEIGEITARLVAIAWPGVPPEAFHGFTAFSTSPTENTTEATGNAFHEVGLYQVEAGLRGGPAPNPDPRAEYNAWGALHDSELVRRMLGRAATMEHNAWKRALADQIAVGLANLKRHGDGINRALSGLGIGARDPASNWAVMTAFTAFSRGGAQARRVFGHFARELASVPEHGRWLRLRELVVDACRQQRGGIGAQPGRSGAAYALVRTEQKFESGYLLAVRTGGNAGWFVSRYPDSATGDALEDVITRVAYNHPLDESQRGGDSVVGAQGMPAPGPQEQAPPPPAPGQAGTPAPDPAPAPAPAAQGEGSAPPPSGGAPPAPSQAPPPAGVTEAGVAAVPRAGQDPPTRIVYGGGAAPGGAPSPQQGKAGAPALAPSPSAPASPPGSPSAMPAQGGETPGEPAAPSPEGPSETVPAEPAPSVPAQPGQVAPSLRPPEDGPAGPGGAPAPCEIIAIAPREGGGDLTVFHPQSREALATFGRNPPSVSEMLRNPPPYMHYFTGDSMSARRRGVVRFLESQPQTQSIKIVYFCCHGWSNGIQAGFQRGDLDLLCDKLAPIVATDVTIALMACSTGDGDLDTDQAGLRDGGPAGDGGFADLLRDKLCQRGKVWCNVLGHTNPGHATRNPFVRRFAGEGSASGGTGGRYIVPRSSPLWSRWVQALRGGSVNAFRHRFIRMTDAEIHAELGGGGASGGTPAPSQTPVGAAH